MGFNSKTLFRICDHSFDLLTVINIGIDMIKNMKIFHCMGFLHRDLKPDNLVFGPLCKENEKYKNFIVIIDLIMLNIFTKIGRINFTAKNIFIKGK